LSSSASRLRSGPLAEAARTDNLEDSPIERLVGASASRAWVVVAAVTILCALATQFIVTHFAMTTDTSALLSSKLPWRLRQAAFDGTFPQEGSGIVVVVDGRTPELSEGAAARLAAGLRAQTGLFHSVERPDSGPFWAHEGLLFESTGDLERLIAHLLAAQPFLGSMAADPSLRGLANTASLIAKGAGSGQASARELRIPLRSLADALEDVNRGKPHFFSWRNLITGHAPNHRELRHILLIDPALNFAQLQPGKRPTAAIRATARRLHLDEAHGVRVRLTGPVPLQDEEFATLTQRAGLIALLAGGAIVLMLWLAVRSPCLIASIVLTTAVGLTLVAGLGLVLFHRFNVISVAFIPLFVGMGMDFGIQFSVRFRQEHGTGVEVRSALLATGRAMGRSLTLAATAIGVGFLAFAPTSYHGVAQLGVIAGLGMFTALALNLTLLPALIALIRPPGAARPPPSVTLRWIEGSILRHRTLGVGAGAGAAVIAILVLPLLHFDFNPMHLRSARAESVATLEALMRDPQWSPNTLEVIRPSLAAADRLAARFRGDPTVYGARTLSSLIPTEQPQKLALIADAANLMDLTLNPVAVAPPPTDGEVIESLRRAATELRRAPMADPSLRAQARRLSAAFDELARGSRSRRARAARMLIPGFGATLGQIRDLLQPRPVGIATLPARIRRQWLSPDGRARVSIVPKGDSSSDAILRHFVAAGIELAPDATGAAIYIQDYARAVVRAFLEAGALSFVAISALLFIALRRVRDVAITLAPIVLTGLLSLATCVLIGEPLNFANIIALPLLFGIGVAFHIYFVMSSRSGGSHLLTSSLARGVFFSALATGTGFGSLWASKDPGTASMGKLLMISLVWTLVSALLFQPALIALLDARGRPPRLLHETVADSVQVGDQHGRASGGEG
jgi:uncharacterized protein